MVVGVIVVLRGRDGGGVVEYKVQDDIGNEITKVHTRQNTNTDQHYEYIRVQLRLHL